LTKRSLLAKERNMPRQRPRRGGLRATTSAETRADRAKRVAGALLCALFVFGGVVGAAIQLMRPMAKSITP
jgi:hypothetical protein